MARLVKHQYSFGNDDKYYIQCSHWSENASSIKINELVKVNKNVAVLQAIAADDTIRKKNRHIVVKISRESSHSAQHEYDMGLQLQGSPGFMKFLCMFPCFDDTSTKNTETKENEAPRPITTPICQADTIPTNRKHVLVMPYIHCGSLFQYNWTSSNSELLKCLVVHTILSMTNAFIHKGFIHRDLHWGNVLFKRTTQEFITYDIKPTQLIVPTNGYKVVIMDFEKSQTGCRDIALFWEDIRFFINTAITKNSKDECIDWDIDYIHAELRKMKKERSSIENINDIISQVYDTKFISLPNILPDEYDPNKY
jgi:serine/threonine protein kinase